MPEFWLGQAGPDANLAPQTAFLLAGATWLTRTKAGFPGRYSSLPRRAILTCLGASLFGLDAALVGLDTIPGWPGRDAILAGQDAIKFELDRTPNEPVRDAVCCGKQEHHWATAPNDKSPEKIL